MGGCGPGIFRRPSAPRRLGAGFGGLAGAGLSACQPSPRESQCPRGGGVTWAGVLAASATASEEPCMSALCVQALSRDPARAATAERAPRGTQPPRRLDTAVQHQQPVEE